MAIIKWDPFEEIREFFSEAEKILPVFPTFKISELPVDIYETDKDLVVEVGLPGFKPDEVKVRVEEDKLMISGEKEEKKEVKEENYYRKEIKKGSFKKVITLPYKVDENKGKAKFEDGILRITFPKPEKTEGGKEIKIE